MSTPDLTTEHKISVFELDIDEKNEKENTIDLKDSDSNEVINDENDNDINIENDEFDNEVSSKLFRQAAGSFSFEQVIIIYLGLSAALLTTMLDKSIEGAVLPNVISIFDALDYNGTISMITYMIGAITQPLWANVSDYLGRRETFVVSTVFYVVGNVFNASANGFQLYYVGVCVSAFGVIGLTTLSQVVIADIFPLRHRGKWQSYFEICKIVMAWAGPYIGEAVLRINWRIIYVIMSVASVIAIVPVVIYLKLPRLKIIPQKQTIIKKVIIVEHALDLVGLVLLTGVSCGFLFAMRYGGTKWEWHSPNSIALFATGFISLVLLVFYEVKFAKCPLLPKQVILNKTAMGACLVTVFLNVASAGYYAYRSQYLQVALGYSPSKAGIMTGFYSTFATLSSILSGYLMAWTGYYRRWIHLGIIVNTVGLFMSAFILPSRGFWYPAMLESFNGFGGGMITCPALVAAQGSVETKYVAITTAFFGFFKYFGSAFGTALTSGIWSNLIEKGLENNSASFSANVDATKVVSNIKYIKTLNEADRVIVNDIYVQTYFVINLVGATLMLFVFLSALIMKRIDLDKDKDDFKIHNKNKNKDENDIIGNSDLKNDNGKFDAKEVVIEGTVANFCEFSKKVHKNDNKESKEMSNNN